MPLFSKVFKSGKDAPGNGKRLAQASTAEDGTPAKTRFEDSWARHFVGPPEVAELLHVCTQEMKSRALDMPFLLLPFRPSADPSAAKNFIRNYFQNTYGPSKELTGEKLHNELRLTEPLVLCSIMKWCWSRLNGGVVTWNTYELFKTGEKQSNMAKHAFDTLIPLSVENSARKDIIFDFFDLLSAIAANGKTNGLGGRKLSRLAGWWAFELTDDGRGFDGGYKNWEAAANASSHLFFAYLRSLAPETTASSGMSKLPRSLQALVAQTEYPPESPATLHTLTPKVLMAVDSVSPTPFALLRRAKNFEYHDDNVVLQKFSQYEDPVKALTFECRRVLDAIAIANSLSTQADADPQVTSPTDASWSRFEDIGFSSLLDDSRSTNESAKPASPRFSNSEFRSVHSSGHNDLGRPTTPSWADFLSAGFSDDTGNRGPASLLLPPDQMLPPINQARVHSAPSPNARSSREEALEPGELANVSKLQLDETFWWVWMTSLAAEEPAQRKAVFGRCAFIETDIAGGRWLVVEEQLKGAKSKIDDELFTADKKTSRSLFGKKSRTRRHSATRKVIVKDGAITNTSDAQSSKITVGADQQARVQAAAEAMIQKPKTLDSEAADSSRRRTPRTDENIESKHNSVMTLQPVIMKEAGPAMQWARKFDKETVRQKYLGDDLAGRGISRSASPSDYGRSPLDYKPEPTPASSATLDDKALPSAPHDPAAAASQPPPLPPPPKPLDPEEKLALSEQRSHSSQTKGHAKQESEATIVSNDVVSSKDLNHTHRKPLSVDKGHPALRNQSPNETKSPVTALPKAPAAAPPAASAAAAAAAAKAMQKPPAVPPTAAPVQKSKKGSTRVMSKLFGRKSGKNDSEEPEAIARHRQMMQSSTAKEPEKERPRRHSNVLRKKAGSKGSSRPDSPVATRASTATPTATAHPPMSELERGEPGPDQVTEDTPAFQDSLLAPQQNPDAAVSVGNISNFTQGGPEDLPATIPEASTEEHLPHTAIEDKTQAVQPIEHDHDVDAGAPEEHAQHAAAEEQAAVAGDAEGDADASSYTQLSSDRWAQIRKNAAERRTSDEHASRPSQSQSGRTDEEETSGEETIEQRVARIKARVAELTRNANTSPPSTAAS